MVSPDYKQNKPIMINDNRWGILYCPKHEMFGSPKRRWEKIEACLKSNGVEYDFVQSESSAGVDRLIKMMINNGEFYLV